MSKDIHDILRAIARNYYNQVSKEVKPLIEGGFVSSLLLQAIEEGKIESPSGGDLGLLLKKLRQKNKVIGYNFYLAWREKTGLDKNTHEKLSKFLTLIYIDQFSRIVRDTEGHPVFNLIGDPNGSDLDVLVKVTNQKPLFPPDLDESIKFFVEKYGKDGISEEDLDLTFISSVIETEGPSAGRVSFATDKGGKETINIGFHTYHLHSQSHPPFFKREQLVLPQTHDQVFAFGKWTFDKMKKYLGKERYKQVLSKKKEIYDMFEERNRYGCQLLAEEFDQNKHRRLWKSIVMKISQMYIYLQNKHAHYDSRTYIKSGMAEVMGEYFPEMKEHFLHSLVYREYPDQIIPGWFKMKLLDLYCDITEKYFPAIDQTKLIPVDVTSNPTKIPDQIFEEWVKSPKSVSRVFAQLWLGRYGFETIGLQFVEDCQNVHLLKKYPWLHFENVPQRSREWMHLYNDVYITGRNTGVHDPPKESTDVERIIHYSNLIGGNMGESVAFSYLTDILENLFPWKKLLGIVTVGMLSYGGPGTIAFCPDGMAVFEDEIIPIEIKTFQEKPAVNSSFMRGYSLARQQLLGATRILNSGPSITSRQGLGVFLFIDPSLGFGKIHTHLYQFDQTEIEFLKEDGEN